MLQAAGSGQQQQLARTKGKASAPDRVSCRRAASSAPAASRVSASARSYALVAARGISHVIMRAAGGAWENEGSSSVDPAARVWWCELLRAEVAATHPLVCVAVLALCISRKSESA